MNAACIIVFASNIETTPTLSHHDHSQRVPSSQQFTVPKPYALPALTLIGMPCSDAYNEPHEKWVRVAMFIGLSATGFVPYAHYVQLYGLEASLLVIDVKWCAFTPNLPRLVLPRIDVQFSCNSWRCFWLLSRRIC